MIFVVVSTNNVVAGVITTTPAVINLTLFINIPILITIINFTAFPINFPSIVIISIHIHIHVIIIIIIRAITFILTIALITIIMMIFFKVS